MPRRLPPLNALKAFEAAARHESFTRAAEELCVTQGAVSHQVKALEAELGLRLFNRERQRLVITEAGRAYLVVIRDAFDRIGEGTEPGLHVIRLCTEELFPVCSPKLLDGRNRLRTPSDLGRFTLLHVSERQGWRQWLDFAGVNGVDPSRGPVLNQASMAIDAAVNGQGIALARTALASCDLISGRLVRPFSQALEVPYAFWIV